MGVIKNLRNKTSIVSLSQESLNSLGISQPSTPPTEPVSDSGSEIGTPASDPPRRMPSQLIERLEHHRPSLGARKTRRANNTRALQTLIEDDFEETGEPTIADFQPKSESAFTQLLNDCDNMRVWQYFISRTENEQMTFLEAVSPKLKGNKNSSIGHGVTFTQRKALSREQKEEEMPEVDGFVMVPSLTDCREVHPAYTPDQHFNMVEPQLRSVLKRKHLSLGILSYLEEEIVDIFVGDPLVVYISPELSSYERLLLHGLCQFHKLKSKSMTIARTRRTKVTNRGKCFHAPKVSLTQHLENGKN